MNDETEYWKDYEFDQVTLSPQEAKQHEIHDTKLGLLLKTRKGRIQLRAALESEECVTDFVLTAAIHSCLTLHNQKQSSHMRQVRRKVAKRRREQTKAKRKAMDEKDEDEDEDDFSPLKHALSAYAPENEHMRGTRSPEVFGDYGDETPDEAPEEEDSPPPKRRRRKTTRKRQKGMKDQLENMFHPDDLESVGIPTLDRQ